MAVPAHQLPPMDRLRVKPSGWQRLARPNAIAAAAGIVTAIVLGAWSLIGSAPTPIARDAIVIDTARRGPLTREITAPGRLVTEETRLISAQTRAKVERRLVEPGNAVEVGTSLLVLSNPDLERALLEARKELSVAKAELISKRAELDGGVLDQESTIRQTDYQRREATRQATALDDLAARGEIAKLQWALARDRLAELEDRERIERQKKQFLEESRRAQIAAQQAKIGQLATLVAFQADLVEQLNVTAPIAGVVQSLAVQEGEWIDPGHSLAEVIVPGRLKAELRLSQTDADQVGPGQSVAIDTRLGIVAGTVSRVEPSVKDGAVLIEVRLGGPPPKGARAQLTVKGTVRVGRVEDAIHIARPPGAVPFTPGVLFRVHGTGDRADRVNVAFGLASSDRIQLLEGAVEGERFVVSDTSGWSQASVSLK